MPSENRGGKRLPPDIPSGKRIFYYRYVKSDGTLKRGVQTLCLYALYLDLLPDAQSVAAVTKQLVTNIENNGNKLGTGFLGTAIILPTLTKIGRSDVAYTLPVTAKQSLMAILRGSGRYDDLGTLGFLYTGKRLRRCVHEFFQSLRLWSGRRLDVFVYGGNRL